MYEQYLGAVVTDKIAIGGEAPSQPSPFTSEALTEQERRQKRKSQGIYYTPSFVTRYIVQQTAGRYLEEYGFYPRPPRVLDMACGSGSFLIEAFDCLDRYLARQSGQAAGEQEGLHDQMRRIQILTQCLYGVDKDHQAVEVARLNLLLRALYSRDRLPLLTNIYHGDSLHAETWRAVRQQMGLAATGDDGLFDVIIGNPPYVRQETLGPQFKAYARQHFATYAGAADLYIYFIEQAHRLLKPGGYFGMIVSNKWMRSNYGRALREFLERESQLLEIVDFGELPVFAAAATFPAILITRKEATEQQQFLYAPIKRLDFESLPAEVKSVGITLDEKTFRGENWALTEIAEISLIEKMQLVGLALEEYVQHQMYRGVVTGCHSVFVIDRSTRNRLISEDPKSAEIIKPFVFGDDVRKYHINYRENYVIFTRRGILIDNYPAVKKYLSAYKERLMPRPKDWQGMDWPGRKPGAYEWYEIQDTIDYYQEFEKPKIIYPDIAKESRFAFDQGSLYPADTTFIIPLPDLYLLGILNSRLAWFAFKVLCPVLGDPEKGGRLRLKTIYTRQLPIRRLDLSSPAERAAHDEIVRLVQEILALHKDLAAAEREMDDRRFNLQQRTAQVDREIDRRVYALYGLTEEEIKVVEGR